MTLEYLNEFKKDGGEKVIPKHNLGFIAVFGEQRLRDLPPHERAPMKQKHNNFGVGKTHLQIALAKRLIKDGFNVLVVSDVTFMDELIQARMMNDEGETLNKLLHSAIHADVLVWDDIGKAKWSEAKEALYYQIINERYRKQKPIVFNSNEDRGTLSEKSGMQLPVGCLDNAVHISSKSRVRIFDYKKRVISDVRKVLWKRIFS